MRCTKCNKRHEILFGFYGSQLCLPCKKEKEGDNMKSVNLIIVHNEGGDWEGIFVNGILETESHNLYTRDWIDLIHKYKTFGEITRYDVQDEYMSEIGSFPNKFDEIPKEFLVQW